MSSPAPFDLVGDLLARSLSIRHVYGEPVQRGDTTVIPVASIAYAFGAGGGHGSSHRPTPTPDDSRPPGESRPVGTGAGGGGGVRMTPVGALEIGPQGTRFIRLHPIAPWVGAGAVGLVAGWLLASASRLGRSARHFTQ